MSNSNIYLLSDVMSQYSIDLLRAFNSDGDISDKRWRAGIAGIRSWNREVLEEEAKALVAIDTAVDKLIVTAAKRYAPRTTDIPIGSFLRHFMNTLAQTSEVLDRSILNELSFDDRANIFRRITRRALYLCCQNRVGPSDSISQVMFRHRKGALTSWRSNSGSTVLSKAPPPLKKQNNKKSSSSKSSSIYSKLEPKRRTQRGPDSKGPKPEKGPEKGPEPELEPEPEGGYYSEDSDYGEVSRCFEKLDR